MKIKTVSQTAMFIHVLKRTEAECQGTGSLSSGSRVTYGPRIHNFSVSSDPRCGRFFSYTHMMGTGWTSVAVWTPRKLNSAGNGILTVRPLATDSTH
jgi:hypothetical protein